MNRYYSLIVGAAALALSGAYMTGCDDEHPKECCEQMSRESPCKNDYHCGYADQEDAKLCIQNSSGKYECCKCKPDIDDDYDRGYDDDF